MLPIWLEILLVLASATGGVGVGYFIRGKREMVLRDREALRKRNALAERGRTNPRRPEHDGEPPSRVHRMRIRNERPSTRK